MSLSQSTALLMLLHMFLLSWLSTIAGVTHWKLQDNSITPLDTDPTPSNQGKAGDVFAVHLAESDPEFAILIRHTTRMPVVNGGGGGTRKQRPRVETNINRQKGGGQTKANCPVLSVDLNSDGE